MAIFTHEEYEKLDIPSEFKPESCFLCTEKLKNSDNDIGGLVYWQGNNAPIALHQSCAVLLSIHLIQDARSLVSKTKEEIKIVGGEKRNMSQIWFTKDNK